jgi:molybdenum cofactor biosynthesis protein B
MPSGRSGSGSGPGLRVGVLTASDTRTPESDGSGRLLQELLSDAGHRVTDYRITSDDTDRVEAALIEQMALGVDVIVVTGGTGLSPRDQVPEALARVCTRLLPGFGELFRQLSFQEIGSAAMASRATAGSRDHTLLFALPGSPAACRLGLERLILPELPHLMSMLRGEDHGS